MKILKVPAAKSKQRLDLVAADWQGITRSQAGKAIRAGEILLNNLRVKAGEIVEAGDKLTYEPPARAIKKLNLPIVYEDDDIIVVDKPAGLIVHPSGHSQDQPSLADFLRSRSKDPDSLRPGIVHRLDKDTSGLIIGAKTTSAKDFLQRQFATRTVEKEYLALVTGILPKAEAEIDLPIGPGSGIKRRLDPGGKAARTKYHRMTQFHHATLVQAWPKTGRTHQLRVHFAAIGHPVVGDALYGRAEPRLNRQFLHAHKLAFKAPNGQRLSLTSPMPKELRDYLEQLS